MRLVEIRPDGWVLNQKDNSEYVIFHICKGKLDEAPEVLRKNVMASWRPVKKNEEDKIICSCCDLPAPDDMIRVGNLTL